VLLATTLLAASAAGGTQPAHFEVRVDVSRVPNAKPYVKPTRKLITEWYPKINTILFGKDYPLPLNKVQVIFEPKSYVVFGSDRVEVPAHEEEDIPQSVGRIHVNFSYLERVPQSVGRIHVNFSYLERVKYPYPATLIHELTHVNQQYKNCPEWLNEGMADYVRHKYFEHDIEPKLLALDGYRVDQAKLRKEGYLFGYTIAAPFLFWLELRKDSGLITALNHALREGSYSNAIFQERCGAPLDALWSEFIAQNPSINRGTPGAAET
jgi:hypothetical protein